LDNKYKDWIEDFSIVVSNQLGTDIRDEILTKCERCQNISNDSEMAVCVKEIIERFNIVVEDEIKRTSVMETMGTYCFQTFFFKNAKQVKEKSTGIEEIIKNLNESIGGGEHFKLEGNKILSQLNQCYCQIGVKETKEPIPITYCQCSKGWMKALFSTLLEKEIKVDLIQSILSGSESCKFIVHLD